MARPPKYTIDYFSHDAGASEGRTVTILENHFGHEGYSCWFKLLERVSLTRNQVIDIRNPEDFEFLAAKLKFTPSRLRDILNKIADLKAIDQLLYKAGYIWSQNFVDRLDTVYKTRKQDLPMKPELPVQETALLKPETALLKPENPQTILYYTILKETKVSTKSPFGEFQNVLLSSEELEKLKDKFQDWKERIERLSLYKSSTGKKYKSDYATVLSWSLKDERERKYNPKPPQSCKSDKSTPDPDSYFSGKYGKVVQGRGHD